MHIVTILNRIEKHKGFVFGKARWAAEAPECIEIPVRARKRSKPVCSGCERHGGT